MRDHEGLGDLPRPAVVELIPAKTHSYHGPDPGGRSRIVPVRLAFPGATAAIRQNKDRNSDTRLWKTRKSSWRSARVDESDGLENRCGRKVTVGSNPTSSARPAVTRAVARAA